MNSLRKGLLSDLFVGVAAKALSVVEADPKKSNQHEFNGTSALRQLFGLTPKQQIQTRFIYLAGEQEAFTEDGFVSWSKYREGRFLYGKPRKEEYRLYYSDNAVTKAMQPGNTVFIAKRKDNSVLVVVTLGGSNIQSQLLWLFGMPEQPSLNFEFRDIENNTTAELDFSARFILDELGIEFELPEADWLDFLLKRYPGKLPSTREFADFARQTCNESVSPIQEPDNAIMAWLDHEEKLFRRHEHLFLAKRLDEGFMLDGKADVEGFLNLSKSIGNMRMSRMGYSLEHHLAAVFNASKVRFSHGAITERTSKPDFIFPSIAEYKDEKFDSTRLTMLASKSTLKDRWRQATKEADRIAQKHVFTLERGISLPQTDEMQHQNVQLVLPKPLHASYREEQRKWLWDLSQFIELLKQRDHQ